MKTIAVFFISACMLILSVHTQAQRFMTRNGYISFFSEAPAEDIEAHNRQVNSALDLSSGDFIFSVLMKSFQFEKALMQEHFNENYVLSHEFPNARFQGKVLNMDEIDFDSPGRYPATIQGELTIKGVTQSISEAGVFEVLEDGNIRGTSTFEVAVADYDIKIPRAVINNIAEQIEIKVDVLLAPLN